MKQTAPGLGMTSPRALPRMWRDFSLVQRAGKRRSPALAAFVQACHVRQARGAA